ncbi:hypothetical protein KUTeg_018654 [Tegillarca granosa]|uniref:EF-hand domain-containing protein n=1 Tax=Tegillarca granosa TaxID=220873 RepID=A0ABQ9EIN2_TEGGR|nr:hypothetical protein KUTeg_018654 [Tegillarca granosa]
MPIVMYEGLMTNIERRIQIYPFIKQGTYNVRAMGSLEVENLFGEFQDLDPKGAGIMRPDDIPTALSKVCELINARQDPNRAFHMHTSRSKMYPIHELLQFSEMKLHQVFVNPVILHSVEPRNHIFDLQARSQRKFCKRKRGEISKPGMTSRGARPVRQHHRCDETKILPHVRLGIDLDEEL